MSAPSAPQQRVSAGLSASCPRWTRHWPLLAVLAVALTLRLVFFSGWLGSDDTAYAEDAVALRDGRFIIGADMVSMRIALVSQAALAFALFGVSEWSAALPALVASLATLVIVYAIALILYGPDAGLIAAALLALLPLDVLYASTLLPEVPMGFPSAAAVLLFLLSLRVCSPRLATTLAFAAGLLVGAAYLIKEPAVFLVAAFPLAGLVPLLRRDPRAWLWFLPVAGFAAVFAVETLVYLWSSGELLHRFRAIAANQSADVARWRQLQSLWLYPRTMFLVINQVGLTFWYLAGLALLALRHRLPTPLLVVVWLLLPFLYLQFGSTSLTPYVPLPKQPRYLGVIAAPAVILIAGWLARWRASSVPWSRRAVLALLILYAASSLVLLAVTHADRQMVTKPVRDTARYLDENDLYALHATSLFANTIPLLSSRAEGSRVGRVCVGCSAGPCTTPHPGLLGEVWAIPSGYHGSPAPAVTECGRWRRLSTLEVSPSGAYRRALTVAVAIADRLPYVRESVRRILEPRSVVVHVPLEAAR